MHIWVEARECWALTSVWAPGERAMAGIQSGFCEWSVVWFAYFTSVLRTCMELAAPSLLRSSLGYLILWVAQSLFITWRKTSSVKSCSWLDVRVPLIMNLTCYNQETKLSWKECWWENSCVVTSGVGFSCAQPLGRTSSRWVGESMLDGLCSGGIVAVEKHWEAPGCQLFPIPLLCSAAQENQGKPSFW